MIRAGHRAKPNAAQIVRPLNHGTHHVQYYLYDVAFTLDICSWVSHSIYQGLVTVHTSHDTCCYCSLSPRRSEHSITLWSHSSNAKSVTKARWRPSGLEEFRSMSLNVPGAQSIVLSHILVQLLSQAIRSDQRSPAASRDTQPSVPSIMFSGVNTAWCRSKLDYTRVASLDHGQQHSAHG